MRRFHQRLGLGDQIGATAGHVELFTFIRPEIADSEPPRVRAMLGAIGQQLGQPESRLEALRESLNPLSRFDFGNFSMLEHARRWLAKERKS